MRTNGKVQEVRRANPVPKSVKITNLVGHQPILPDGDGDDNANEATTSLALSIARVRTAIATTDRIHVSVGNLHERLLGKPDQADASSRPLPEGEAYQLYSLLVDLNDSLDRLFDEVGRLHLL